MHTPIQFPGEIPSVTLLRQVVSACERFEAEWKAGRRPTLESFLSGVSDTDRPRLLHELLALELELRRKANEEPEPAEYRARFPDFALVIDSAFAGQLPTIDTNLLNRSTPPPGGFVHLSTACAFQIGQIAGGYKILAKIGAGGMGVVFRAEQTSAYNRPVALKCVRPDFLEGLRPAARAEAIARFRTEIEAVSKLDHPNLVPVYDVGEIDGCPYFSMKYLDGGTLADRLMTGPLPIHEAAALIEKVARAVNYANQSKVLHRDVKPGNILFDRAGEPYVADFGLAKQLEPVQMQATPSRAELGTPAYMSPEQVRGTDAIDVRTDVYGLGATLYHMLTGRPPFEAGCVAVTLQQVLQEDPIPPRRLNCAVDRDLEAICLKCLEKSANRRYATAARLAADLRRFQNGEATEARPPTLVNACWKRVRNRPALAGLGMLSALMVVTLFVGALFYSHGLGQKEEEAKNKMALARQQEYLRRKYRAGALISERRPGWRALARAELIAACALEPPVEDLVELRSLLADCSCGIDVREIASVARGRKATAVAFDRSGRFLAVAQAFGSFDTCNLVLVDLKNGCRERILPIPNFPVSKEDGQKCEIAKSLAFTPDGRWLIAGMRSGQLHRWDMSRDPPERVTWHGHDRSIEQIALSRDGQTVFSGSKDKWIRAWNIERTARVAERETESAIISVAVHPTAGWLTYTGWSQGVNFLNSETLRPIRPRFTAFSSPSVAFFPNSEEMVIVDREAQIWPIHRGDKKFSLVPPGGQRTHDGDTSSVAISSDGRFIVTSSDETREVCLWDYASSRLLMTVSLDGEVSPTCAAFGPDGKLFAVSDGEKTRLFAIHDPIELTTAVREIDPVAGFDVAPDGKAITCLSFGDRGDGQSHVRTWRQAKTDCFARLSVSSLRPRQLFCEPNWLHYSPDGTEFCYANSRKQNDPNEVLICDAQSSVDRYPIPGGDKVRDACYSPDNRLWKIEDGAVEVWESTFNERLTKRWEFAKTFPESATPQIRCVAPGRHWTMIGGRDGSGIILDASTVSAKSRVVLPGNSLVGSVALSPDESVAVLGTDSGHLALVTVPDGHVVQELKGHDGRVTGIAFANDNLLASGSSANEIRLWHCGRSELRELFRVRMPGPVAALKFFPDQVRLAVLIKNERAVRVLHLDRLCEQFQQLNLTAELPAIQACEVSKAAAPRRYHPPEPVRERQQAPHGLREEIFWNHDWTLPVRSGYQHAPLFFNSHVPTLANYTRGEHYSIRWTGWIKAPVAGRYRLRLEHNDSARVWIDGKLVYDYRHPCDGFEVDVDFSGEPQSLRIDYQYLIFDKPFFKVFWSPPGANRMEPLPVEALFHDRQMAEKSVVAVRPAK